MTTIAGAGRPAAGSSATTTPLLRTGNEVRVKVYNASGVQGAAQTLTDKLTRRRLQHADAGQPQRRAGRAPSSSASTGFEREGTRARGATASATVRRSQPYPSDPPEGASDADCIVVIGTA